MVGMTSTDFTSREFLQSHIDDTLRFYEPVCLDADGGFFHYYLDDGTVYNRGHRHLVSATRFVFNWCMAYRHTQREPYQAWAAHAFAHLQQFRLPSGLYAWTLQDGQIEDPTVMAYGQAFVLLAYAHAHRLGLCSAEQVGEVFDRMEQAFYSATDRAYADEITPAGELIDYRGQNANMHTCEACLAAYEATGEARYLERATSLIERFAFDLASQAGGLIWEHYDRHWVIDWEYNRHNPGNIFKPWGFQTGHQTEWAKLMLMAHGHQPSTRWVQRATELHQAAWQHGWDPVNGGLIYGFAPDNTPCDTDKYFWVQAESFASAWRLYRVTGNQQFLDQYQQIWRFSWKHLIDHQYGAWFRVVAANGAKLENTKSPAGKTDYHTMGACWDVLAAS